MVDKNIKKTGAPLVGVLSIQGDYEAHIKTLRKLGVPYMNVRDGEDLDKITHLIIPGGESTTIRIVSQAEGYWDKLVDFDRPVMGTCMGSILMAREIENPSREGWGMMDITIRRNAYGRQINSFTEYGKIGMSDEPFEMVFIRAPKIVRIGDGVQPIAWLNDDVVGAKAGNKMALTFHPELTGNPVFHELLLNSR